MKHTKPQIKQ